MQDLLSSLASPIVIGVIVVVLVILIAVPLILRRRNTAPVDEEPPEFGETVDYTSMEVQEPTGWRERFTNLSLASKILVFVVPLLLVVAVVVLILLLPGGQNGQALQPTPAPPPEITVTEARLVGINPQRMRINATSTLPEGTEVTAQMIVDEEVFNWFNPEATVEVAADGAINGELNKAENALSPPEGTEPVVQLLATVGGQEVLSDQQPVVILVDEHADAFFGAAVAEVQPTPTEEEEPTPSATPEEEPEEETPEEAEPTAAPTATTNPISGDLVATVTNGGNVREEPLLIDNVVAQINAGEQVEIQGRTPNGLWYYIRNVRNNEGWVSGTLLSIDPAIAARVPVLPIVSVFTTGNVYAEPRAEGAPVDQVFVGETVDLFGKTSNGEWYEVETVREVRGWVSAALLGIPQEVAADVPVDTTTRSSPAEEEEEPAPTEAALPSPTPEPEQPAEAEVPLGPTGGGTLEAGGLTAQVQNTGSLRDQPDPNAEVLGEISAGESVELLQKNVNATWFRVRSTQGVEGWVNSSLLTVAPEVKERVPVA
ncbi:MAG: SH3 domain-containing protein [Chloroflexaceae bacterium]